ncbi:hypothetical protein [Psychrobacter fozii]|uniref:Lipoprotein n=1 Tax=Psychrobacter fozii TaxID=198480 RepID=A0A2V4UCT7_9GAMM|nr:hypothetical protein [Psychrobacter fozii]PYE38023.1 hypothetical protein DFP82_110104 [Psychrobacter fozii]
MKKLSLLLVTLLGPSIVLNGCATAGLVNYTKTDHVEYHEKNILSEKVIAVGYPNKPITGYEDAMILAGKNYSFLVQPTVSSHTSSDIFRRIFSQVDLGSLYIDTNPLFYYPDPDAQTTYGTRDIQKKTQADSNELILDIDRDKSSQVKDIPTLINLVYAKPINEVKNNEQPQLENLGFKCQTSVIAEQQSLACQRPVYIELTVASAVQNIDQINHKLKQPMTIQLNEKWRTKDNANKLGVALLPVSVAVDIVTFPIQAIGAGLLYAALANADW